MDYPEPIQSYVASRSNDAFKALIEQYVGLVFSSCLRQLKDRHLAEDATQAVFLLLSQKAGELRQVYLSGWLLTTSRYACANIRRSQQRRQRRERAVAMNPITTTEPPDNQLNDVLDEALCHLKARDREALLLRYFQEQPLSGVAEQLGVSQDAARKRLERGIQHLRQYFTRRGITTSSEMLSAVLSDQLRGSTLLPGMRHTIAQSVLHTCHGGALGSSASVAIANGTKTMMTLAKLKSLAAAIMIAAALGTAGWTIARASAARWQTQVAAPLKPSPAPQSQAPLPGATPDVKINLSTPEMAYGSVVRSMAAGNRRALYRCLAIDPQRPPLLIDRVLDENLAVDRLKAVAKRIYGPEAAAELVPDMTIDSAMQMMGATGPGSRAVDADTAELAASMPALIVKMLPPQMQRLATQWDGAPIRFKKEAGEWKFDIDHSMRVVFRADFLRATGASDAQRDADILQAMTRDEDDLAKRVAAGELPLLSDALKARSDADNQMRQAKAIGSFDIKVVPFAQGPLAGADTWEFYSDVPSAFTAAPDPAVTRDGHAALRLGSESATKKQSAHYQRLDHPSQPYQGHRVRVTAWIKSVGVANDAGIRIRVLNSDGEDIADDGQRSGRPVKGTTAWKLYTATAEIPADAAAIQWGFILNGKGSIWIDLDSAHLAVTDKAGP